MTEPLMTGAPGLDLTEETIFTWGAPPLKFGAGAVDEIGFDMAQFGARRVAAQAADRGPDHGRDRF